MAEPFLLSGTMDLNSMFDSRDEHGDGEGSHTPTHAGANLPETLKWLWRGVPTM